MRFNVGDRVRFVRIAEKNAAESDYVRQFLGTEGTITGYDGGDYIPYEVEFAKDAWSYFDEDELELVEATR